MTLKTRCSWPGSDPLYVAYHDTEWGVPLMDDQKLFEFVILDGMQAGLSWITVLRKREHFRKAFDQFDPVKIARYTDHKKEKLLNDSGIIRNRLKIEAAVRNARAFLALQDEGITFSELLWSFVDGKPVQNRWPDIHSVPAETATSQAMSKALKKRGFSFVGSTICYAFMQAAGLVNDHVTDCFRHHECKQLSPS